MQPGPVDKDDLFSAYSGGTDSARTPTCLLARGAFLLALSSVIFSWVIAVPAILVGLASLIRIRRSLGLLRGTGIAVASLLIATSVILVRVALPPRGGVAHAIVCTDNLRNINLALFQYTVRSDGRMPPADHNICVMLAPHMGESSDDDRGDDSWRCPRDRSAPRRRRDYWCSYVPNASVEETDEVIGAFSSNVALPSSIQNIAPDTISFIEMWTPPEVVPGHPGFELKLDMRKPENFTRSMVEPGKELCAIRSYRTPRPVKFDEDGRLTDCGNYLFLRAFIGKRLDRMYHRGRINVAYIDGHVETKWIKDLIATDRPIDNPEWTRNAD